MNTMGTNNIVRIRFRNKMIKIFAVSRVVTFVTWASPIFIDEESDKGELKRLYVLLLFCLTILDK